MRNTATRPLLAALYAAFAVLATALVLVGVAPRTHADPATDQDSTKASSDVFYIDLLKGTYPYEHYREQTLLQEGHKLCNAMKHGTSEDDAAKMAQSDLGAPYYEAVRVVSSAELALNCSSLKTHGM